MSANGRVLAPLSDAAHAALEDVIGDLARDPDVTAIDLDEGRGVTVTRRARREHLDVVVPEGAFRAFAADGAFGAEPFRRGLASGDVVAAARLGETRRIHVERSPKTTVHMLSLFEEGLLDEESALRLMGAIQSGRHVVIGGPCTGGKRRLAVALVSECAPYLSVARLDSRGPTPFLVAPRGDTLLARAQAAADVGIELLLALDVETHELLELLRSEPRLVVVASVASPRAPVVEGVLAECATVGFSPAGAARVSATPIPVTPDPVVEAPVRGALSARQTTSASPHAAPFEPLPALAPGPPSGWDSRAHEAEPGWELQSSEEPSPFDDVMKAVRDRKTYTPRPPPLHPAASKLRGSGGLTLEPPSGDDDGAPASDGDEESR